MKNPYVKNLNRIEFVMTYACNGRCRHCSEGDHTDCGEHIDGVVAAELGGNLYRGDMVEVLERYRGK